MSDSEADAADEQWLAAAKIARRFDISPRTLRRWSADGRLPVMKTPGGHRRYRPADVLALLVDVEHDAPESDTNEEEAGGVEDRTT